MLFATRGLLHLAHEDVVGLVVERVATRGALALRFPGRGGRHRRGAHLGGPKNTSVLPCAQRMRRNPGQRLHRESRHKCAGASSSGGRSRGRGCGSWCGSEPPSCRRPWVAAPRPVSRFEVDNSTAYQTRQAQHAATLHERSVHEEHTHTHTHQKPSTTARSTPRHAPSALTISEQQENVLMSYPKISQSVSMAAGGAGVVTLWTPAREQGERNKRGTCPSVKRAKQ